MTRGSYDGSSYERLCAILRRCSLDGMSRNGRGHEAQLAPEEQAVLVTLQQAVRDHLERKRRQQPVLPLQPPQQSLPTVPSENAIDEMEAMDMV